jgi:glycosyltransferase involved in cell wall biosynthesis
LEALAGLIESVPNLVYLIVGDGSDIPRLKEKARRLGIEGNVRFTGAVSESEKVDYYNVADAFVMPGRGEGFGIVYLEAMACGIPVMASVLDGSKETLLDGKLGILVNPLDQSSIEQGLREALAHGKGVSKGLEHFAEARFNERVEGILAEVFEY